MKINKFKKVSRGRYKIFFENTDITLSEEVILKYDLLLKNDVDIELIDKLIEENKFYEAYDMALSYIEIKMRNRNEIFTYLSKKDIDEVIINDVINKLEENNYLNSSIYIQAYINDKVNLSSDGPFKIKDNLVELGFDEDEVDRYLDSIDEDIWKNKLVKIVNKKKSLMKSKSYYMFMSKVKNDCHNYGYDKYMIDEILSSIEYESDALVKDTKKYIKKYKGDKNKIISALMRKGYSYDEVSVQIKNELD